MTELSKIFDVVHTIFENLYHFPFLMADLKIQREVGDFPDAFEWGLVAYQEKLSAATNQWVFFLFLLIWCNHSQTAKVNRKGLAVAMSSWLWWISDQSLSGICCFLKSLCLKRRIFIICKEKGKHTTHCFLMLFVYVTPGFTFTWKQMYYIVQARVSIWDQKHCGVAEKLKTYTQ